MENNIKKLKYLFMKIKDMEFAESLRSGSTGLGYTFETLIGKSEDSSFLPDFNGIEIKTKLGYSKSPMTLFTLVPNKDNDYSIKYLLEKFGYPDKTSPLKCFRGDVFAKRNNIIANKFIFKTKINQKEKKLNLIIFDTNFKVIDDTIYWNLEDIHKRLIIKLNYLAIIKGYPYKKDGITFYKYTNLSIYKLKGFDVFLNLLTEDKIYVVFNIGMHKSANRFGQICDRGTAFRITLDSIDELFDKID